MKWGDSTRDSDTILAVWPTYDPVFERWPLEELADNGRDPPYWRARRIPTDAGNVRMDVHMSEESARTAADLANERCRESLASSPIGGARKRSLQLRAEKGLQAKARLAQEEALMLAEAMRRGSARREVNAIEISDQSHSYRHELLVQLEKMPYLTIAMVGEPGARMIVFKEKNGRWSSPYRAKPRSARIAVRDRIAGGFGLSPLAHWGKTKAEIRQVLLPRANQLLQLASVQRLLAEALARGQRVLVCNGIVFWYEDDRSIGWQVKETSTSGDGSGDALWLEGTIRSTNHGRIVVLPYIKENGEQVRGHTKNAPNDGKALPRHPDHYVDIPFQMLDGDLMIGLFGELPYE